MTLSEFVVASDHPSLPGHFPGSPVVPGVVLLDHVISIIEADSGQGIKVSGIKAVKFLQPLLPEQSCRVDLDYRNEQSVRFKCFVDKDVVASGQFTLEHKSEVRT